ncbi:lipase family alpha/beta hydrolase [Streptomyces sp. NPDC002530]
MVFVHGLHADPGVWKPMEEKFENNPDGDFPSASLHAFDYSGTTEEHVTNNAKRLSDWLSSQNLGEVDVVSHSLGGLVARKAQLDGAKIRRIITLATPNHGTGCCYPMTGTWDACKDMWRNTIIGTQSQFLTDLNEQTKPLVTPDTVLTYAVNPDDGQVDSDSVELDGAVNLMANPYLPDGPICGSELHNSILVRDNVATDSMNFLRFGATGVSEQTSPTRDPQASAHVADEHALRARPDVDNIASRTS